MSLQNLRFRDGALRLHRYLVHRHVREGLILGPDPGVRFNLRFWRFAKSYLRLLHGPEKHFFLQGMSYWILSNRILFEIEGDECFSNYSRAASDAVINLQKPDGSWQYPLRERKNLTATIEGNWAALALLQSFRTTKKEEYYQGALNWKDFLLNRIGFQTYQGTLAVNYFDQPRGNIPNNSTNTLWLFAELTDIQKDPGLEEKITAMKAFLVKAQRQNGELPYILTSPHEKAKAHYLCYQYNAFEFLDLIHFNRLRNDGELRTLLHSSAGFLEKGMDEHGRAKASCSSDHPTVYYFTAALATALWEAYKQKWLPSAEHVLRGFSFLLDNQKSDGSFPYSTNDYGFLRDNRSYPRYLAMILYFLCLMAKEDIR